MDPASLIMPGAQSLVAQILSDGWVQVRQWLSLRLGHQDGGGAGDLEGRLDMANAQADALPVPETASRRAILEAYWAGYLAALVGEHPELTGALAELAASGGQLSVGQSGNSVSGTVTGNVVQAHQIDGGVRFG